MYRNSQNNDYRNYSYLPPSISTSSRNTDHQYYKRHLCAAQIISSNTTLIPTYTSPSFPQQYQLSTIISNLGEPTSIFDDRKPLPHRRHTIAALPPIYIPPNPSRRSSVHDARLATASATRQRLLTDIQRNISEINRELSSLAPRCSIPRYIPPLFSSFAHVQQTSFHQKPLSSNHENQILPYRPKSIGNIIPHITSESTKTSQHSTPKLTDQNTSQPLIGQYHYGAEIEENEILEKDPENLDLKSFIDEIPQFSFDEILSLDEFCREQSDLAQNRALILVPEYGDNDKNGINESTTEDIRQNNSTDANTGSRTYRLDRLESRQDLPIIGSVSPELTVLEKIS
ncbi:unnamed protein product [Rotaria sp. Silwood1]|nr:unnamed protein product [Rotaria sp. Silwood1]CAF3574221.1 unnamed protein product [Rotaria sp. Silwood1]CAF3592716.1 unnamed protein product [Rotaria sp. Silwood1]CAF4866834.1 unnamed protein product [Rotaria sp. Silwood1]